MENVIKKHKVNLTKKDYPLGEKRPDLLFSRTEKSYDELTLDRKSTRLNSSHWE